MQEIKSFFTNQIPTVPIRPKKAHPDPLPLQIGLDYCNRFRPLFDKDTFSTEVKETSGQLIEYLQETISSQYQQFTNSSKYISIGCLAMSLGLAMTCHKVKLLAKLLGEKSWKMFSFKSICLVGPYYLIEQVLLPEAEKAQIDFVYSMVKDKYRRFKLSGDITQLNPSIELTDPSLDDSLTVGPTNANPAVQE